MEAWFDTLTSTPMASMNTNPASHAPLPQTIGQPLLELTGVRKHYGLVAALSGVDLRIAEDEFVVIAGPSGAGKSALINILAGLETHDDGELRFRGEREDAMAPEARALLRRQRSAVNHNLYLQATVEQAVTQPLLVRGEAADEAHAAVDDALEAVGLAGWEQSRLTELSYAQRRRAGIARALVTHPAILLMDVPSGVPAMRADRELAELLRDLSEERGIAVVLACNDPVVESCAQRVLRLGNGRIVADLRGFTLC